MIVKCLLKHSVLQSEDRANGVNPVKHLLHLSLQLHQFDVHMVV